MIDIENHGTASGVLGDEFFTLSRNLISKGFKPETLWVRADLHEKARRGMVCSGFREAEKGFSFMGIPCKPYDQ